MGIKTVPYPPYSPDLAPYNVWLLHKLRARRYETIEEMKEAVTKVIDTLTQEDFHGAFQKLLERQNKCIAARGDYIVFEQEAPLGASGRKCKKLIQFNKIPFFSQS